MAKTNTGWQEQTVPQIIRLGQRGICEQAPCHVWRGRCMLRMTTRTVMHIQTGIKGTQCQKQPAPSLIHHHQTQRGQSSWAASATPCHACWGRYHLLLLRLLDLLLETCIQTRMHVSTWQGLQPASACSSTNLGWQVVYESTASLADKQFVSQEPLSQRLDGSLLRTCSLTLTAIEKGKMLLLRLCCVPRPSSLYQSLCRIKGNRTVIKRVYRKVLPNRPSNFFCICKSSIVVILCCVPRCSSSSAALCWYSEKHDFVHVLNWPSWHPNYQMARSLWADRVCAECD